VKPRDIRISIVVTSFNHRAYLVDAIESVLAQTHPPHEIIVADDASSDGSQATIRDYERRYPALVRGVFQPQNVGIPANRNAALHSVTGNFVGILDGDDWFLPHKLERQVAALRADPEVKVAYSNFRIVDSERREKRIKWRSPPPSGFVFADIAAGRFGLLRTLIADYDAVRQAGCMDTRFPRYDGFWLSIKLAATCKIAYLDEVLLDKRDHASSDSKTLKSDDHRRDLEGIYGSLLPLLPDHASRPEIDMIKESWRHILGSDPAA
jgi:glycosyltransferase involved in cell wall biosynthesis